MADEALGWAHAVHEAPYSRVELTAGNLLD
jgi:hypothetical protein